MQSGRYTRPARILHWLVGLLVIGQITLGFFADSAPNVDAKSLRQTHAEVGVMILKLMVLRVSWRIANPPPSLPATIKQSQQLIAGWVHRLLYAGVFIMLTSGLTVWMWIGGPIELFGAIPVPLPRFASEDEFWLSVAGYTHEYGALAITMLVVLHIGAALWHELVLRDRLIRDRML